MSNFDKANGPRYGERREEVSTPPEPEHTPMPATPGIYFFVFIALPLSIPVHVILWRLATMAWS